jgi:chromate reductase
MVNIVLISGSLRTESANAAALRAAAQYITGVEPADGQDPMTVTDAAIDDLPLYSEDLEEVGWPSPVQRLRSAVATADALMIATPEYNGSMSGVLKNALDWLSRPYDDNPLQGKPAATLSASPSSYGAKWAHDHLRHVLEACGVRLVNPEAVTLPQVFESLDAHGDIVGSEALTSIRRLADEVLARVRPGSPVAAGTPEPV